VIQEHLTSYKSFFEQIAGFAPYRYQERLSSEPLEDRILQIPTGFGKTLAVVGAWLWNTYKRPAETPRRLIYCLPTRVLVEQTIETALRVAGKANRLLPEQLRVSVFQMLGGDADQTWESQPDRRCLIVGTQDMLLSRALNRGYGLSMFRWPLHFALMNNDVWWVADEVQLFGCGLPTTVQLAGLRRKLGCFGPAITWWMSATLSKTDWETPDYDHSGGRPPVFRLTPEELDDLSSRWSCRKTLQVLDEEDAKEKRLAALVLEEHRPGALTLVVLNTVPRAQEVYSELQRRNKAGVPLVLLHSRFRPPDRQRAWKQVIAPIDESGPGRIVVATQVIEAGADLDAAVLFTDLAPQSSLVQRFGRLNRSGRFQEGRIFVAPVAKLAPYKVEDRAGLLQWLKSLNNAAPADLKGDAEPSGDWHVLRKKDLLELFDTTPDLTGAQLDVSRFVRELDQSDVEVFWRSFEGNPQDILEPHPNELCPAPLVEVAAMIKDQGACFYVFHPVQERWIQIEEADLRPGQRLLLESRQGGYSPETGWSKSVSSPVVPLAADVDKAVAEAETHDADPSTFRGYRQALAAHCREVHEKMQELLNNLANLQLAGFERALLEAAAYHDWGKAHAVFQQTLHNGPPPSAATLLAKAEAARRHARRGFRHELAGAVGLLGAGRDFLSAYLTAAHHGKVRMNLRSLPDEDRPEQPDRRYARGIFEGEFLPAFSVPVASLAPVAETRLSLDCMELGSLEDGPSSWGAQAWKLLEQIGPFRLSFLEMLVRVADLRASADPQEVLR